MSKEDSKIMQGVAILLMLFFHLFNYNGATEYQGTIDVSDIDMYMLHTCIDI